MDNGNYIINTSSLLKIDMTSIPVPTPSSASVQDKKTNRSITSSSKSSSIAKIVKRLNQKSIYKINNPVGRVIAMHERLHSSIISMVDVMREQNNPNEVNELESSLDKLFDQLVVSLQEATSNDSDPQWEEHTKE